MDFDIPTSIHTLRKAIRQRVAKELAATPGESLDEHRIAWSAAGQLGLTGLCVPAAYGGRGLGALETALCLEAFGGATNDLGLAFGIAAHLLACTVAIRDHARPEVRAELLPRMAAGLCIGANAMTEDDAGSDTSRMVTSATRTADGYRLSGTKSFVSNAPLADVFVVYARTNEAAGHLGISAFVVPAKLPGISVSAPLRKASLAGCLAGRVSFEHCLIPARFRLGDEGAGSGQFQHSMTWERAVLFALYLGRMESQLNRCIERARDRRQFGKRIADFQAVSHRIAVMLQRLEGARLLLYRACWLLDRGDPDSVVAASLSKVAVSEAAVANGLDALQLFGASGQLVDTGIEQQLRDALPSTVFSGTSEIQREIIARVILA